MSAWSQIDVFVKNTSTVPSFQMAYTDPMKDVDVSGQMEHGGVVEMGLTMMWYKALKDKCIQRDGSRALVVDVGGNFGWYSIYAATLGCRLAFCSDLLLEFWRQPRTTADRLHYISNTLFVCNAIAEEHMHKLGDRPCCHSHVAKTNRIVGSSNMQVEEV